MSFLDKDLALLKYLNVIVDLTASLIYSLIQIIDIHGHDNLHMY